MAVSRLTQTTLQNGFEKFNRIWDERSAVGSMEAISAITLSANQTNIEFNNIPSTYTHLQLRVIARSTSAGSLDDVAWQFNGDTSALYANHHLYSNGDGTAYSTGGANATQGGTVRVAGATANSGVFGVGVVDILDYANTSKFKTVRTLSGFDNNGDGNLFFSSNLWRSTSAIASINLFSGNGGSRAFTQYSSFSLYGIK